MRSLNGCRASPLSEIFKISLALYKFYISVYISSIYRSSIYLVLYICQVDRYLSPSKRGHLFLTHWIPEESVSVAIFEKDKKET